MAWHDMDGRHPGTPVVLLLAGLAAAASVRALIPFERYAEFDHPIGLLRLVPLLTLLPGAALVPVLPARRSWVSVTLSLALLGSVLVALAANLTVLIAGAALQGLALAVVPVCAALVRRPVLAIAVAITLMEPPLRQFVDAGVLPWVSVVFCASALIVARQGVFLPRDPDDIVVRIDRRPLFERPFDPDTVLLSGAAVCALAGAHWLWSNPAGPLLLIGAAAFTGIWAHRSGQVLSAFPVLVAATLGIGCSGATLFVGLVDERTGPDHLALVAAMIVGALVPTAPRLPDYLRERPVSAGCVLMAVASCCLSTVDPPVVGLTLLGLALGFTLTTVTRNPALTLLAWLLGSALGAGLYLRVGELFGTVSDAEALRPALLIAATGFAMLAVRPVVRRV